MCVCGWPPLIHTLPPFPQAWGFSPEFSFRAPPPPGPDFPAKFLAVADLGQSEPDGSLEPFYYAASLNTTRLMARDAKEGGYQLLLHNGGAALLGLQWALALVWCRGVSTFFRCSCGFLGLPDHWLTPCGPFRSTPAL